MRPKYLYFSVNPFNPCIRELLLGDIDLATAVGHTQLNSTGKFQIERHGKIFAITGTVVNSIKDRYKFNPGEQFPPVTPITTADELNLLEKCRGANQFNQDASWTDITSTWIAQFATRYCRQPQCQGEVHDTNQNESA